MLEVDPPAAILLFGTNCAGKSTVGREVARRIARCAFIEVDELRYMVQGGLVAASGGRPPGEDVEEYARQGRLAVRNGNTLALGVAREGFSSVIEGLDDEDRPPEGEAARVLGEHRIVYAALVCREATLTARLVERGLHASIVAHLVDLDRWCRDHADAFDILVDTGEDTPQACADGIAELLLR